MVVVVGPMKTIATYFRGLQLFAHNAHNLAKGPTFLEDHEFFGSLYGTYESAYDSVVERMIGLGEEVDLAAITKEACAIAGSKKIGTNEDSYKVILATEKVLREEISKVVKSASDGTQNLLQGLADDSEKRTFLISRRLKA